MKRIILAMLAVSTMLIFSNCSKKTGPQGPPGLDGNANVIGGDPFSVNTNSWQFGTLAGQSTPAYVTSFNLADITNAVANHGLVEIYIQYPDFTWKNLPDIINGTSFSYNFSSGGFDLYFSNVDGSTPSRPPTETFRTVIIPSSLKQAHPNTDWTNYETTMSILNAASQSAVSQ